MHDESSINFAEILSVLNTFAFEHVPSSNDGLSDSSIMMNILQFDNSLLSNNFWITGSLFQC